ncbi:MAG: hypothetical protein LAO76_11115 [Acidobacteriia bacterium]|nr:hypothetical protein [Terriglobia bacterium]
MESENEKSKRKVHRSPSYPAFDLGEAIQKAEAVYKAEKRTATTSEVIASHVGYSQATGPGGRAVSALRQYGLLEENAGRYRISDLGYTLVHFSRDSEEWKRAVVDASRRPVLFKELLEKYGEELPSDATLKNELLSRGFNPAAVSDVVTIFRNTMSLAGEHGGSYNNGEERTVPEPVSAASISTASPAKFTPATSAELSVPVEFAGDGQQAVVARVLFNAPIKREYLSRLKAFLEAWEKTLPQ